MDSVNAILNLACIGGKTRAKFDFFLDVLFLRFFGFCILLCGQCGVGGIEAKKIPAEPKCSGGGGLKMDLNAN